MQSLVFKLGSSFKVSVGYTPTAGLAPTTLAGVTITSQIRKLDGTLVADLAVVKAGDNLSFVLSYAGSTANWPLQYCIWDIKMVDSGVYGTFYSETVELRPERQVTA